MKKRIALVPTLFIGLTIFLAATLASSEAFDEPPEANYLPLIAKDSGLLYLDDFSDQSSGWEIGEEYDDSNNVIVRWSYQSGEYEMLISKLKQNEKGRWAAAFAPVRGFHDYGVEADMRRVQGDVSEYGLIFDLKDGDNFYVFSVHPGKQTYALVKREDGIWDVLIDYSDSADIKPDNETNRLRADRYGSKITLYANGVQLATTNGSGFIANPNPGVGLFTTMIEEVPAGVRYDNFEVWREGTGYAQPLRSSIMVSPAAIRATSGSDVGWTAE